MKRSTAFPFLPFAALLLTTAVATQAPTPDQSADLRAKAIDVRLAAIDAMVLSTKKDADSLLLPLLADKDWEVQERTAMALGKRKCAPSARAARRSRDRRRHPARAPGGGVRGRGDRSGRRQ